MVIDRDQFVDPACFFNASMREKERILEHGKLIYMELVPNLPKSPIVQGDNIRLRYKIVNGFYLDTLQKRGFIVVMLDTNSVAAKIRLQPGKKPLNNGEFLIEYNKSNFALNIGTSTYSFQQGKAPLFMNAKYGALRVDADGNSVLLGLYDEQLHKIE